MSIDTSCPSIVSHPPTIRPLLRRLRSPNTGVNIFESDAILEYLDKQYAVAASPVNIM
jgi:glutathione S-transferase